MPPGAQAGEDRPQAIDSNKNIDFKKNIEISA